jgi:tetratricopeptide (TPR) repeat protein
MDSLDMFFNNTTSQFYVVLTGTSSFLSGVMMFLEWLHFTYFGISIVDRLSTLILHFFPFLSQQKNKETSVSKKKVSDLRPVRNPMMLFRGAEYNRFFVETKKEPLTEYDISLTTSDLQNIFCYEYPRIETSVDEITMLHAWREEDRKKRISLARKAISNNAHNPGALIILAEEEAPTILQVEELLRTAVKSAEIACKQSHLLSQQDQVYKPLHERNGYILAYCKIRLAVCLRKLGRVKDAIKIYRDLSKDDRSFHFANIHENLIECLLDAQNYSDVQQIMSKQDEQWLIKSTVMCYTYALLKAKAVGEKFCADAVSKRGPNNAEMVAVDAIHIAVEMNPHVPRYLLELKSLVLPPEHFFKRGDSEAVAYAFHHLQHWKRVEGALSLLGSTWEGTFRRIPFPLERGHHFHAYPSHMEQLDRQVLPPHHELSLFPQKDTPFFMVFTGVLCFSFMTLTVIAYHFPKAMTQYAKTVTTVFLMILEKLIPTDIFGIFS